MTLIIWATTVYCLPCTFIRTCTFILQWQFFPPALLLGPARLFFNGISPPCTFNRACTFIRKPRVHMNTYGEFLVTPWAAEWLFTSVSSLMLFQTTLEFESLVTPWAAEWLFSWSVNCLSHLEQLNDFSPVWVLWCSFKRPWSLNFLSHLEQLNDSSPVWVLWCSFKRPWTPECVLCSLL